MNVGVVVAVVYVFLSPPLCVCAPLRTAANALSWLSSIVDDAKRRLGSANCEAEAGSVGRHREAETLAVD